MTIWIRHTHPNGFRSGEWAKIVDVVNLDRPCFEVRFPDGTQDIWVIHDPDEPYEFADRLDENRCDFDCDNCHMGGCGNPACERGGCHEANEGLAGGGAPVTLDVDDQAYVEKSRVVQLKKDIREAADRHRRRQTTMDPTWSPTVKTNVFFTSDLHIGHARIVELCNRPFRDVDHMNEQLVERWNERVTDVDIVFILGDLALGKIDESLEWVKLLLGRKMLVPGNHDRVWSGHPKKGKPVRPEDMVRYEAAGIYVMDEQIPYVIESGAPTWLLCHFPDVGDSHDADRFDAWRPKPPHKPNVIIHGHVHEKWVTNGPRINVGVDVWGFAPAHQDEVRKLAEAAW